MVSDYILGDSTLHYQLCAMAEILGKIISRAPYSVSISQLEEATERTAKELTKLCASLKRAELLRSDPETKRWMLACEPSAVTLEDVFRCIVSEQPKRVKSPEALGDSSCVHNGVDLLLTQATLAINQSIFKKLGQFSLDRLKICATGLPPSKYRPTGNLGFEEAIE